MDGEPTRNCTTSLVAFLTLVCHPVRTWEDPECDINDLDIKDGDSLLVITSAGDNVLHYAIRAKVDIQSVDMNP